MRRLTFGFVAGRKLCGSFFFVGLRDFSAFRLFVLLS